VIPRVRVQSSKWLLLTALVENAPVTLGLLTIWTTLSVLTQLTQLGSLFEFSLLKIIFSFQLWRMFCPVIYFSSLAEWFIASVLLYQFRLFERRFSSPKFATLFLTASLLSAMVAVSLGVVIGYTGTIRPGPMGFLATLWSLFWLEVTPTYSIEIPDIPGLKGSSLYISEKVLSHLLACLYFSTTIPWEGLLMGGGGLAMGIAFHVNAGNCRNWTIPTHVMQVISHGIHVLQPVQPVAIS
jgi:hypothetical protein